MQGAEQTVQRAGRFIKTADGSIPVLDAVEWARKAQELGAGEILADEHGLRWNEGRL